MNKKSLRFILFLSIMLAALFLAGCNSQVNFQAKGPQIKLSETFFDLGDVNPDSGLRTEEFIVKNTGKTLSNAQSVIIYTSTLVPYYQKLNLEEIPPYGSKVLPVSFSKTSFLTNKQDLIRISLGGNILFHKVKITPIFFSKWVLLGGGVIVAGIFIISIITFKPWNLPFFRSKG